MSYTGYQTALTNGRPEPVALAATLGLLDRYADSHGITYTAPAIKNARHALERADELRATLEARAIDATETAAAAGRQYLDGKGTAADVVAAAVAAAPLIVDDTRTAARRLVDVAAAAVEAEGVAALRSMTEEAWLKPIRPVMAEAVALAHEEAEAVGIAAGRPAIVGLRTLRHPWAPDDDALQHTPTRHAWERLGDALDALDDVFTLPDSLRRVGLLATVPGRVYLDDYRWLRLDQLEGKPAEVREFWMANRHEGEPGVWTAAEMAAADRPAEPEPTEAETVDADETVSV